MATTTLASKEELITDPIIDSLIQLSPNDIINACQINRLYADICRNNPFIWSQRLKSDFNIKVSSLPDLTSRQTWNYAYYLSQIESNNLRELNGQFVLAAKKGYNGIIPYILNRKYELAAILGGDSETFYDQVIEIAIENDNLDLFKILYDNASKNLSTPFRQQQIENYIYIAIYQAAESKKEQLLQSLINMIDYIDYDMILPEIIKKDNIEATKIIVNSYLNKYSNNELLLKFLQGQLANAAFRGQLEMIKYLQSVGVKITNDAIAKAELPGPFPKSQKPEFQQKKREILNYLIESKST